MTVRSICVVVSLAAIFLPYPANADIFELVNNYEGGGDIKSADFNNDGLDDFILAGSSYQVFLSNGDCSFELLGLFPTNGGLQVLTGDFTEDGNVDFISMSFDESRLFLGDGTGAFSETGEYPWRAHNGCVADFNSDGHIDIAGAPFDYSPGGYWWGDTLLVMLGDGTGGFIQSWI